MAKPKAAAHGNKRKLSVSPNPDLLAWIEERTGDGKEFATLTHAVERGFAALRDIEEGKLVRKTRP
jgi:hypothetical protein